MDKDLQDRINAVRSQLVELKRKKMGKHHLNIEEIEKLEEEYFVLSMLRDGYTLSTYSLTKKEIRERYKDMFTEEQLNKLLDEDN